MFVFSFPFFSLLFLVFFFPFTKRTQQRQQDRDNGWSVEIE